MGKLGEFLGQAGGLFGAISDAWRIPAAKKQAKKDKAHEMAMVDKTHKENRFMAEYQYSKDLESWNRNNQYNSPEQQMIRLKAAGLNPNLVGGATQSGNAKEMPKYQAPTADYTGIPSGEISGDLANAQANNMQGAMHTYLDLEQKNANILNTVADTRLTDTRRGTEFSRQSALNSKGALDFEKATREHAMRSELIRQMQYDVSKSKYEMQKAQLEAQYKRKEITYYELQLGLKAITPVKSIFTK